MPLDMELVKTVAPLGVGGILAAFIFVFYRRDFLNERADRQAREAALLQALNANTKALSEIATAVQTFAGALTREVEHSVRAAMAPYVLDRRS